MSSLAVTQHSAYLQWYAYHWLKAIVYTDVSEERMQFRIQGVTAQTTTTDMIYYI
jgi:hypothetical protein